MLAATSDAFREEGSRRQLSDRIIMTAGELGDWSSRWTDDALPRVAAVLAGGEPLIEIGRRV